MKKILSLCLVFVLIVTGLGIQNVYATDASDIKIAQESNVDVVLSVGNSSLDINNFNQDLRAALIAKGVPDERINISSIQSATSSTDTQSASDIVNGWLARPIGVSTTVANKDTDYAAKYAVDGVNNWIASTATSGRPAAVYFDPNGYNIRNATIEYTWGITNTAASFAHGEAGFIFRMDESRDNFYTYTLDNHAACGNLQGFGSDGTAAEAILKFNNGSNNPSTKSALAAQINGTNMYASNTLANPAALKLNDFAVYAQGRKEYVKIELNGNNIKVYRRKNNNSGTDVNALDKQDPYALIFDWTDTDNPLMTGTIGFYVWDQSGAYFSDITISTESTRGFAEIIRQPQWRSNAEHFVVNLEDNLVSDFEDQVKLGEILSRMGNEDINYLGWGTSTNQTQAENFIDKNNNKGMFTLNSDYEQSISDMADYIYNVYFASKVSDVVYVDIDKPQELTVTPNEEKYNTTDENWPNGKWRIEHNPNYYDQSEGLAVFDGQYLDDLDVTFTKPGEYEVYYKDVLVKTVRAHRKPFALFNATIDGSRNVTITDLSYDLDHMADGDKGIASKNYEYKETTSTAWTAFDPSSATLTLEDNKDYIVRLIVQDNEGQNSSYYNRYLSTNASVASVKAVPEFYMDKDIVSRVPGTVNITNTSYSPTGALTNTEWTVLKNNTVLYTNTTPKSNFSDLTAGTYKIRLRVQNAAGWSDYFIRTIQVIEDSTQPSVVFTPSNSYVTQGTDLVLTFSDAGGSGLSYQQAVLTQSNVAPGNYGGKGNTDVRKLSMTTTGEYYVHYKAEDNSGNLLTGVYGPINVVTHPDWIALGEALDNLEIGYQTGDSASSVTQNVVLPLTGTNDASVTWSSGTTLTIDNNGNVFRPIPADGNKTVVMTATLKKGIATTTKVFNLNVISQVATDEEAVIADKAHLQIGYASGDSENNVTQDVTLPTTASNGSTVSWSSSVLGAITNGGVVTRPAYNAPDTVVTLTATITKGVYTETRVYDVIVKKSAITDTQAVADDKASLDVLYAAGDYAANVTRNIGLVTTLANGSSVAWTSDDLVSIATDGTVTRPIFADGDKTVTLEATITKGAVSDTKQFILTVKSELNAAAADPDADAVAADESLLDIIYASGDNASNITQNITLVSGLGNGTTITWASSDAAIDSNGLITRPANGAGDTTVTLTATITKNLASLQKVFNNQIVKELPAALPDGTADVATDKVALAIGYAVGDDETHVTQNVVLPLTGASGTVVTWNSDKPVVIDLKGNVFRPSQLVGDETVLLTATISKNGASDTQTFTLLVKQYGGGEESDIVIDKTNLLIQYGTGDEDTNVTKDIVLPETGNKGSTVVWTSSDTDVIALDGKITRPEYGQEDKWVTLTATITLGGETDTKVFKVLVKAKSQVIRTRDDEPELTKPTESGTIIIVNGKQEVAGKESETTLNGKKSTFVEVTPDVILKKIEDEIKANTKDTNGGNTVEVPIKSTNPDNVKVALTGDVVKKMEDNTFNLLINSQNIDYVIPAKEINIMKIADVMGVTESSLRSIEIEIYMDKVESAVNDKIAADAQKQGYELMLHPVDFKVIAKTTTTNGAQNEVVIDQFSQYVERILAIPSNVDPSKITTGIVYNEDGVLSHIPTEVFKKDNQYFAKLSSLTNSSYSIIWNPIEVASVEHHWAKEAVNNMASRLVLTDIEGFKPDANVTRAEYASYIVKALGLYRTNADVSTLSKFTDISGKGYDENAIAIATQWSIINGYPDGTFRGDKSITREEAMAMYSKAMEISQLVIEGNNLVNYTDANKVANWAKPMVEKVVNAGVFNGRTKNSLVPNGTLTHAESLAAIQNLLIQSTLINK